MSKTLLTIAIPTYNRAKFLKKALESINDQLAGYGEQIEIIVSDNCSTDNTADIVNFYLNNGLKIRYIFNAVNKGVDFNIKQCFIEASGKFVLVFGDDDFFLEGAIAKIITILEREKNTGIVYLKGLPYNEEFVVKEDLAGHNFYMVYQRTKDFITRVNYNITFISGNIINKNFFDRDINFDDFENTNLIQLSWMISVLTNSPYNIVVEEYMLGVGSVENTGGYKLYKVFGENFNMVMNAFRRKGFKQQYIDIINKKLIAFFFPSFLVQNGKVKKENFVNERPNHILYTQFKHYLLFWIIICPIIILPESVKKFGLIPSMMYTKLLRLKSRVDMKTELIFKRSEKKAIALDQSI